MLQIEILKNIACAKKGEKNPLQHTLIKKTKQIVDQTIYNSLRKNVKKKV